MAVPVFTFPPAVGFTELVALELVALELVALELVALELVALELVALELDVAFVWDELVGLGVVVGPGVNVTVVDVDAGELDAEVSKVVSEHQ